MDEGEFRGADPGPGPSEWQVPAGWPTTPSAPAPYSDAELSDEYLGDLLAGAPREVLHRLLDGDPLGLGERSLFSVHQQCLLLQPDRLFFRLCAHVAKAAVRHRIGDDLDAWVGECMTNSIDELLQEDWEAERLGTQPMEGWQQNYGLLAELLEVEPAKMRGMCVRFNHIALPLRRAFHRVVIQRVHLERYASEAGIDRKEAVWRVKEGFLAILVESDNDQEEPR